jgi:hypothetical protein
LLNQAKCGFEAMEVTFIGYTVLVEGTRPLEEKAAAIKHFRVSLSKNKDVSMTCLILPVVHSTSRQHKIASSRSVRWTLIKGSQKVKWTPTMVQAFEDSKAGLTSAKRWHNLSALLALLTYASDITIGAALQKRAGIVG